MHGSLKKKQQKKQHFDVSNVSPPPFEPNVKYITHALFRSTIVQEKNSFFCIQPCLSTTPTTIIN